MKHDPNEFLDSLRQGLNDIDSKSVILQVLPQPEPVVVDENILTEIIFNEENVVNEEEDMAENIYTIMEMKEEFLQAKGIDNTCVSPEDITQDLCEEFREFIRISQDRL